LLNNIFKNYKMNFLLTGNTGFIGTNLQNYLLQSGFQVQSLSLRSPHWKKEITSNFHTIVHLAGKAHDLKKTSNTDEYYKVNTELTKKVFDAFLYSNAKVFITLSSVKAVADQVDGSLTEEFIPAPITHYGKSKLLAEQYILSKEIPEGKRVFILRPCMIHGPGNKGNLNLLYQLVSKGIPWPLGAFENSRSFCSIDNLMFIIKELIEREDIPSGVYNIADDEALSTNEVISVLAESKNRTPIIWKVSKGLVQYVAKIGNLLRLPLNEERLHKLTDSYVVSNRKIKTVIGKPLPVSSKVGLLKTFKSFS
jgi:nucleoside-diphosphate-sugar epimerase